MKNKVSLWLLTLTMLLSLMPAAALAATPVPRSVVVSPQSLTVDGVARGAQKYNIDGSNYFKLRDLAYLLSDTESRFAVGWNAATSTVSVVTGMEYTPNGGELQAGADRSATAVPSTQTILVNGERRTDLYVYNIGGENYFKLRDLGTALGFTVDFDAASNTAVVESKGYRQPATTTPQPDPATPQQPEPQPTPAQPESEPEPEPQAPAEAQLTVGGKTYALGMTEATLTELAGEPDDTLAAAGGYTWYVFGSGDYRGFLLAGLSDGKVVTLVSGGKAFTYLGCAAGATSLPASNSYARLYTDKNDGGILHAVMLRDSSAMPRGGVSTDEALRGESIVNFHMTNAFRVYHGLSPFRWSEAAAEASRLHSQDMADQNYFEHDSLDGRSPWARMEAQGIRWSRVAENIAAGHSDGVDAYNGWVNSAGHRSNMLGACQQLGVGAGYNASSAYRWYMTQDFFTP